MTLYQKSVAAMKRYFRDSQPAKTAIGRCAQVANREHYRAGWMRGYRAGLKARRRS